MSIFLFNSNIFLFLLSSFFISSILTYIFIKEKIIPNHFSNDINKGSQKIHDGNIKRIGGFAIVFSFMLILTINELFFQDVTNYHLIYISFYCAIIFMIGLSEDLIKDINPITRLFILLATTCIWLVFSENLIRNTNIDFVDNIIAIEFFAVILSMITINAALNATNMMDGANGLLTIFGICVSMILLYYAYNENDVTLMIFLLTLIGSLFGFLVFNWPKGFIFLGDGGSYFIGAILSSVLIYMSNSLNNFNMLNALVIMIYPIWELVFTVFRRFYFSSKITHPDNLHLHTILNANIKKINFISNYNINSNPLTGIIINIIALFPSTMFLIYKSDQNLQDFESIYFFMFLFSVYTSFYLIFRKINKS